MDGDENLGVGKTCFIISPIGSKLEPAGSPGRTRWEESTFMWESVFQPACEAFGLLPIRADKISDSGEIPDQIFTYLRDADVVIADVSHANPNVMYELGLRHTRPGITLQIGEYKLLPFDVTTIRTIQFNRTEAGLIGARNDLQDALRTALRGGGTPLRVTTIWGDSPTPPPSRVTADAEASRETDDDWGDEPGAIDILADGETAIHHYVEVMADISAQIQSIGETVTEHTALVAESDARQGGFGGRMLIARGLSKALSEPASSLEVSTNEFYDDTLSLEAMIDYVTGRVGDENIDDTERAALIQFGVGVLQVVDAVDASAIKITEFRQSIRDLRKFSKDLRPTLQTLDRATSRFLEGMGRIQEWRQGIEDATA